MRPSGSCPAATTRRGWPPLANRAPPAPSGADAAPPSSTTPTRPRPPARRQPRPPALRTPPANPAPPRRGQGHQRAGNASPSPSERIEQLRHREQHEARPQNDRSAEQTLRDVTLAALESHHNIARPRSEERRVGKECR